VAGQGPLQGIAAGLAALRGRADVAYVSSCDVPLLRAAFVARMLELLGDADIVVPEAAGRQHPLAGVYRLSILPVARRLLGRGQRRLLALLDEVRTRVVGPDAIRTADPELASLRNINTPEDLQRLVDRTSRT
jgi:molybdopterin-guanine dinucleotide biosynthesis protein A